VVWYVTGPDSSTNTIHSASLDLHISLTVPGHYVVYMSAERAGVPIVYSSTRDVTVNP
jgi:hypothetical protein